MPLYNVTLPIAGHAYLQVEAENEKAAIEQAFNEVKLEHIEEWKALEEFNRGNATPKTLHNARGSHG